MGMRHKAPKVFSLITNKKGREAENTDAYSPKRTAQSASINASQGGTSHMLFHGCNGCFGMSRPSTLTITWIFKYCKVFGTFDYHKLITYLGNGGATNMEQGLPS